MNKVTEEAMTNMIRRIEILESQIANIRNNVNKEKTINKVNTDLASKAQIDYLRSLGGKTWENMSKIDAGKGISALLEQKNKEVKEPAEVDTDNAGLDGELL